MLSSIANIRAWAEVNDLKNLVSPSELGRLCQCLLALSFEEIGYHVDHFQFVGRPDFTIDRGAEGYAVEAKAPLSKKLTIKQADLRGIRGLGHKPILAVLTYPDLATRWLIIEIASLLPKTYTKMELSGLSNNKVEEEVSTAFSKVVLRHRQDTLWGASNLRDLTFPRKDHPKKYKESSKERLQDF